MKRMVIGALGIWVAIGAGSAPAYAAPKRKHRAPAAQHQSASTGKEIQRAMGEVKWGMEREQVLQHFMNAIREKYRPQIAKATGAIEEDRLRAKMREELQRLRASLVDFNGRKTGWDVSFLKGEFTHGNGESMFVVNDSSSQNYYFFMKGRLWKWYKAFDAAAFQGKPFERFGAAVQGRFGKAKLEKGALHEGQPPTRWLEWNAAGTRVRGVDNKQFYGFYSLVFEDQGTLRKLAQLRSNKQQRDSSSNAFVEAVTGSERESDYNADVVDRITGKIRHRQQAPEEASAGGRKPTASAAAEADESPGPSRPVISDDDDPLKGLL